MPDAIILNNALATLRGRKQVVADELTALLRRVSDQSHPALVEATMDIEAHPNDLYIPPYKGAIVEFVALSEMQRNGEPRELILYRRLIGRECTFGEFDRKAGKCITMRAPRFVDIVVLDGATQPEQEVGFVFLAQVKQLVEVFATAA